MRQTWTSHYFAPHYVWVRTDWPLGPALEQARIRSGISGRAAAKRAGISSGRWYQLVSGVQKIKGQEIPISTTASTVVAVAKAVDLDINEALKLAGFDRRDVDIVVGPPPRMVVLDEVPTEELLDVLRSRIVSSNDPQEGLRRLGRALKGVAVEQAQQSNDERA